MPTTPVTDPSLPAPARPRHRYAGACASAVLGLAIAGALVWTIATSITRSDGGLVSAVAEMSDRPAMVLATLFAFAVALATTIRSMGSGR